MIKFYNLWELYEHDLFDNIKLPEKIDKETLVNTIFMKCATYSPLYHEHDLFVNMINSWFLTWYDTFDKIVNVLEEEYNPLYNYDRFEDIDRKNTEQGKVDMDHVGNNTFVNQTSAFDTENWQNANKEDNTRNMSDLESRDLTYLDREYNHLYGNIGVTTSQQMLESEIKLRDNFNIYMFIANKFYDEFMLKIEI